MATLTIVESLRRERSNGLECGYDTSAQLCASGFAARNDRYLGVLGVPERMNVSLVV